MYVLAPGLRGRSAKHRRAMATFSANARRAGRRCLNWAKYIGRNTKNEQIVIAQSKQPPPPRMGEMNRYTRNTSQTYGIQPRPGYLGVRVTDDMILVMNRFS